MVTITRVSVEQSIGASLDADGFERCFRAILPALTKYAWSLARDWDFAQDLVQETSLRAWQARSRFSAGTNFKAWCYRILKNCFLTNMRRHRVARTDSLGDDMPDAPVEPVQEVAIELQEVGHAWDRLTPDHQRSLGLVAIDGLSYEEAALADGVPLGTMKSRVARARQALTALMESAEGSVSLKRAPVTSKGDFEVDVGLTLLPSACSELDRRQVEMLREWRERRHSGVSLSLAA